MIRSNSCLAFAAAACLAAVPAAALSFGVGPKGGVNFSSASIDEVDDPEGRTGLALGAVMEIGVTRPYSILVEATYLQRGASFQLGEGALATDAEGELNYLEIPVLVKAKFGALKTHAYAFAGPSIGIKLSSRGEAFGVTDPFEEEVASGVFSGQIGGGGAAQIRQYVYVSADLRYVHGFSNALEQDVGPIDSWHHRDVQLMVGVLFHLTE